MDIELARTFLEVLRSGSFIQAAKGLNVTQTTVTSRIQNLESRLNSRLLKRDRKGVVLTPQGERFVDYAKNMVQLWERARQDVPIAGSLRASLQIGGELSLWNPLLLDWLLWLRQHMPDIAIRANAELPTSLIQKVLQHVMDVAVVYSPQYHPQLQVELLMEETLVLVSTHNPSEEEPEYINIDWGSEFTAHHEQAFPELQHSRLSVGLGPLGLHYILKAGGRGYLRVRAVQPYIESGQLHRVMNAPEFTYPVYIVYSAVREEAYLHDAIQGLKQVATQHNGAWPA